MPAPAAAVKGEAKTVKREKAEPKPPKPKDQKTETPETKEKPVKKAKESKETMVVDVLPIALQVKHKLEVTTVRSQYATNTVLFYIFDRFTAEMYALYRKYQITVHKDAPDSITEDGYKRFLVETPLKVRLKEIVWLT